MLNTFLYIIKKTVKFGDFQVCPIFRTHLKISEVHGFYFCYIGKYLLPLKLIVIIGFIKFAISAMYYFIFAASNSLITASSGAFVRRLTITMTTQDTRNAGSSS